MANKRKLVALIVPCYNERETIDSFVKACDTFLADLKERYDFVTIFIDDGSTDNTLQIMKDLAASRKDVRYISFSRNSGKERGLYAGFCAAESLGCDACIPMDVDLQDPPELIPQFFEYWEQGYDYIYAHMNSRKGQRLVKKVLSSGFYRVYSRMTGDRLIQDGDRDFCLMDRKVLDAFVSLKERARFNRGVADFVGFKRKRIDYDYVERKEGKSKYNLKRMLSYSKDAFTEFARAGLLVPDILGVISVIGLVVFAVLGGLNIVGSWYLAPVVVFAVTLVLSILVRVIMGLLYDIRDEVRDRPLFFIADTDIDNLRIDWR